MEEAEAADLIAGGALRFRTLHHVRRFVAEGHGELRSSERTH
jgi:hypothetical protein